MADDNNNNNVAAILEFLRKHRFTRAEAALREEVGQRGGGELEADQNLILKLRSAQDAVDTTGFHSSSSSSSSSFPSLILQHEEENRKKAVDGISVGITGQMAAMSIVSSKSQSVRPAECNNNLFSSSSSSLLEGSQLNTLEVEEPLEFWTIKEIQAELPQEEEEEEEDEEELPLNLSNNAREGKRVAIAAEKNPFQNNESSTDTSIRKLPPFVNGTYPPDKPLEKITLISEEKIIRGRDLVSDNASQNGKTKSLAPFDSFKGIPLKTMLPPLPFSLPLESESGLSFGLQLCELNRDSEENRGKGNQEEFVRAGVSDADKVASFGIRSGVSTEELPKLPPVKLHTPEKKVVNAVESLGAGVSSKIPELGAFQGLGNTLEGDFKLGAFLDLPFSQEPSSSGGKRLMARPSVSQGIIEDALEHPSSFVLVPTDAPKDFMDEYWDSDTYEDDDDPGYIRQPIEDEAWFLANEIDYPSDDERSRNHTENNRNLYVEYGKLEDENGSLGEEEESFFSGEEYCRPKGSDLQKDDRVPLTYENMYNNTKNSICDDGTLKVESGKHYDASTCLNLTKPETSWSGFAGQGSATGSHIKEVIYDDDRLPREEIEVDDDRHGLGGNSDAAEMGSEVRENIQWGSSEGDLESVRDRELIIPESDYSRVGQRGSRLDAFVVSESTAPQCISEEREGPTMASGYYDNIGEKSDQDTRAPLDREGDNNNGGFSLGGFSFPSSSTGGDIIALRAESGKSLWSTRDSGGGDQGEETDEYVSGVFGPDDTLAAWKRKSNESSPMVSPGNKSLLQTGSSLKHPLPVSTSVIDVFSGIQDGTQGLDGQDASVEPQAAEMNVADDEDAIAEQEQIRRMGMEEDEYEVFDLRIIHRKNRTGFEEEKDLPVVLNCVIAGRYHVTEYLGSAAFSKAIQAHDVHTGMDVCMKIIKNNKDFFDQSLDEIKLLKYVNKHDPADKHHILRLYDYFYHREHLFIVCELLRANLYEFQKFNRESGGEVYFTMPRLQSIARQCLEALEFLHGLGLIHCDLKPENILVKSYSRCEIKVIDLGSSCFQTDHLCSYVQSRSYRAPEVILGLPYDQKIDIWSLGCILAELCSGNVLFQNDSIATLLARVVGILGPINPEMLTKGKDSNKYFTKNHMLYERNQENDRLEYLLPKKTSLTHRLPMGDKEFVAFVTYLLQVDPKSRPTASEALKHHWFSFPYEPISS